MTTTATRRLRDAAKRIPPLYWLVGALRYLQFRRALAHAERHETSDATLPPPMLRYRVHRALDEASYVEMGRAAASDLAKVIPDLMPGDRPFDALDLGCGPGRVATWFKREFPQCRLVGSDIDAEAVAWAAGHLSRVACFETNAIAPPLRHAPDSFDLVYCVSLFTHLDEALQDRWLAEIARVLKPGGYLVATTHGTSAAATCTPAERLEVERRGIAFRVDRKGRFKLDGLPDFYQTTFHSEAYVKRHWSKFMPLVALRPGGLGRHQDLVVLRKPAAP